MSGHLVETKSKVGDPDGVRRTLHEGGAVPAGVLRQRDTYFRARSGWLKLRQEQVGNRPATAALIAYERAAGTGHVLCTYSLTRVSDPDACRHGLAAVLGVLVVVDKRREALRFGPTVVHLDEVMELGWYVELETETAGTDPDRERAHHRLAALLDLPAPGPPVSYADLLIGDRRDGAAPTPTEE